MSDYERIARIIRYLDAHQFEQPDLATLAEVAGLSPSRLHRLFSAWAGITPKEFLRCLTLADARQRLRLGESVLETALATGLSGPGRLHDLCVSLEAASPEEVKSGGEGWTLTWGWVESPFGSCLLGESPRGLCHLSFPGEDEAAAPAAIAAHWPRARLLRDDAGAARLVVRIFEQTAGGTGPRPLRAYVRGTPFQVRVWRALLQVPPGALVSYGCLAAAAGRPAAARAAGAAAGANPLAVLIPCHRVIRATGAVGGYRWGTIRKRALLAWESRTGPGSRATKKAE